VINYSHFNYSSNHIIKYPIITDKATRLLETNKYSFIVDPSSDKISIRASIEDLFNVKVIKINTCHLPRKKKRVGKFVGWKPKYKKSNCNFITRRYNKFIRRKLKTI